MSVLVLGVTGLFVGLALFAVARKFSVDENPKVKQIEDMLPGANCGGCGYPGCAGFAKACVNSDSMDGLMCTVCDKEVMQRIADLTGHSIDSVSKRTALVRCNGSCENRPSLNRYDGARSCAAAALQNGGETGCSYGCIGFGDCVSVCGFDAIHMNPETGLPAVDQEKCTGCGLCAGKCPKNILEIANIKDSRNRRVYVSCVSRDKGPIAKNACKVACIGCGKCVSACAYDAIAVENSLAYVDQDKCRLCRKCESACPQHSIIALNFTQRTDVLPSSIQQNE